MAGKRDLWLATGVALVSLAGFLVLRPQPVPRSSNDRPVDAAARRRHDHGRRRCSTNVGPGR